MGNSTKLVLIKYWLKVFPKKFGIAVPMSACLCDMYKAVTKQAQASLQAVTYILASTHAKLWSVFADYAPVRLSQAHDLDTSPKPRNKL